MQQHARYIFVTGGVVSGLGKGITAASLGRLLKARGLRVAAQKLDPYLNVDPGTISPYQHGEVFVTKDGAETDLDLGHYERFMDEDLGRYSNLTAGRVYWNVLNQERAGRYLGETVQMIPHVTDEIKRVIYAVGDMSHADVVLTEIGGTIGDMESQPFLEAVRQISRETRCLFVHVTLVPYLKSSGEHKSKPTQHSVRELQGMGIMPDILVARCDEPLGPDLRRKIASYCNVESDCVIENRTLQSLYEAPLMLRRQGLDEIVCRKLGLPAGTCDLSAWEALCARAKNAHMPLRIALVGKYVALHDAYLSVAEALRHAGYEQGARVEIAWIDAGDLTGETAPGLLGGCGGVLVPGGFGERGVEGMIAASRYARETGTPYLGICLGMQVAVIDCARNLCGIADAGSREFSPDGPCVIDLLPDQQGNATGGTMRLGSAPCRVQEGTLLRQIYGTESVQERHRHRYEVNNAYRETLAKGGLVFSGLSPDGCRVEAVELDGHPFYLGVQFHPEFQSRPNRVHPIFHAFVEAALRQETKAAGGVPPAAV